MKTFIVVTYALAILMYFTLIWFKKINLSSRDYYPLILFTFIALLYLDMDNPDTILLTMIPLSLTLIVLAVRKFYKYETVDLFNVDNHNVEEITKMIDDAIAANRLREESIRIVKDLGIQMKFKGVQAPTRKQLKKQIHQYIAQNGNRTTRWKVELIGGSIIMISLIGYFLYMVNR